MRLSLRSSLTLFIAAATVATVAAGPTTQAEARIGTPEPSVAEATGAAPIWGECPPVESGIPRDPRQQCATLQVPLDYRAPRGRSIEIAISRIGTAQPGSRRGILLSNPGGPGVSGLDLPSVLAVGLPREVLDRYDLIGFDPRGVGRSTPVTCGLDLARDNSLVLPYPAPDGGIERNVAFARNTAAACAKHSGDLLPFVTTANTARDMDRIRAALGEPRLSYIGGSYGTYLGAVYVSMFPGRTDRIVLDSAVDPGLVWRGHLRSASKAVAVRLPDLLAFAAERDAVYHLGTTPDEVRRSYDRLVAALDRQPLPIPGGLMFDGNTLRETTRRGLSFDARFPLMAELWRELTAAISGSTVDTAILARLDRLGPAGRAGGHRGAGTAQTPADNHVAALYAVICGDVAWPRSVALHARQVAADRRAWPVTAGMPSNIWPCAAWPTRPVEPPVKVTDQGPRNVLILQNTRDPITPLAGARGLRAALGQRAVMVTVDQGGHGVFGLGSCADETMNSFLATGALPRRDRFCPAPSSADAIARSTRLPYLPSAWPL
ncbi:alpha/beta hydrolase [Sinosporangium siamense]|uniref:Alpha/beta hydrolase n=1 Tax=Sinosporangium siamense TaxID=1367973 RepID=A0A919V797_9ACTN|nr:alpha/beta hydrolase [Sinosporangium siamense]GII94890.1 alpha/beta hydrolase [Sinosporangium siamense]